MLCYHPWQNSAPPRSPYGKRDKKPTTPQQPRPAALQRSPPRTKTAMLLNLLDSQPEELATLDKYTVGEPVEIVQAKPAPNKVVQLANTIATPTNLQENHLAVEQEIIDDILWNAWRDSRKNQKPLPGCWPYTFRLPLPHLEWDVCIGGKQELDKINMELDTKFIIVQQRIFSRRLNAQMNDFKITSDIEDEDKELVVLPSDLVGFISNAAGSKQTIKLRLDQMYDLCFVSYHRELMFKKENIRLLDFLRQRFDMMQNILELSRTDSTGSRNLCES